MEATSQSHAQTLQGDDVAAMSSLKKKEAGYGCNVVGKIFQNHTDGKPNRAPWAHVIIQKGPVFGMNWRTHRL